ncbi:hypothetical protein HY522_12495 [bacterium]|nr:hypothetical protein [bacterium]
MTQYYAVPKFSLNRTRISNKVLITLFLIGTILAIWLSLYTLHHRTGLTSGGVVEYYLGNEGSPSAAELKFAKSTGEMLEFFHIHSFTLLLLIFILCHFAALTTVGEMSKIVYFVLTFVSFLSMMAFPWLIRFGSHPECWAGATLGAGGFFLLTTLLGGGAVLFELWVRPIGGANGANGAAEPLL